MKPSSIPEEFRVKLITSLTDSARPAYGQVATADERGVPHVRTVHLRHIPEFDSLGFVANQESLKWKHLQRVSEISGCYFDSARMVQFRWLAKARMMVPGKASPEEVKVMHRMWMNVRSVVRSVYWYDHLGLAYEQPAPQSLSIDEVCPTFTVIVPEPYEWDYYELLDQDYRKHRRRIFNLKDGTWKGIDVKLLTAEPLSR